MSKGRLIVISGFSGSGKGTVVRELLRRYPDEFVLSISATTRQPRTGEEHGREYFFTSVPDFEEMIAAGDLLEHARFVDHYYGTPRSYVEQMLLANKNVLLEIEMQGAVKVKEAFPETLMVFLIPPSAAELYRRLCTRGTETKEVIRKRMERAAQEAKECGFYDYLIINDDLDQCVEDIYRLIKTQHQRMIYHTDTIEEIRLALEAFAKGETL